MSENKVMGIGLMFIVACLLPFFPSFDDPPVKVISEAAAWHYGVRPELSTKTLQPVVTTRSKWDAFVENRWPAWHWFFTIKVPLVVGFVFYLVFLYRYFKRRTKHER